MNMKGLTPSRRGEPVDAQKREEKQRYDEERVSGAVPHLRSRCLNVPSNSNKQKKCLNKNCFFVGSLKVNDEKSRIRIQDPDPDPLVRGMDRADPDPLKNVMDRPEHCSTVSIL